MATQADGRSTRGARTRWTDRVAARVRPARMQRPPEAGAHPVVDEASVAIAGPSPVRVLLFGTGSWSEAGGLDRRIAESVAAATGRGVLLDGLVAPEWTPPDPVRALDDQSIERYDAVIVISTYRPSLIDVPVDRWLGSVVQVRDLVIRRSRADAVVQVLSLPWRRAAADAPDLWGGELGRHLRTLDRLADASVDDAPGVLRLTLSAPAAAAEWSGPSFSDRTHRAWGDEIAAQLAPRLAARTGG